MVAFAPTGHAPGCPPRSRLIQFDSGLLGPEEFDSLSGHLLSCDRCARVLHDLHSQPSPDPLLEYVKRCVTDPPPPIVGACARMAEAARAMCSSAQMDGRGSVQAPESGLPAGSRVGQYELLERIGQGGMGVVYRARQGQLDRPVALKMILSGHHARPSMVARFVREGQMVGRLGHPNVVQVFDLGVQEGLPFLSMELVEGGTLQAKLAGGPMEPRAAAELLRTLARAVEYAHGESVIHRDLKPSNILLARDGTPKIGDFGLAKLLEPGSDASGPAGLTESDAIMGTASYMAPEQVEGRAAEVGRRADVYALGAILYESMTGRPPFVAPTPIRTLDLVRKAVPTPPSQLRPEVPHALEDICLTCLEKSPARRYPTAGALADDLDRWLRDGRPQGARGRRVRLALRLWRPALAGLLGLVVLGVATAMFVVRDPDRAVRQFQTRLAGGTPVALILPSGRPAWVRWRSGESRGRIVPVGDGTFNVQAWHASLLELLPDPQCRRYRFTVQVRHEESADVHGEVGLYVARTSYPGRARDVHAFTQLSFNALRTTDRGPELVPRAARPRRPRDNYVALYQHVLTDQDVMPCVDRRTSPVVGPSFRPRDEHDRWHTLEVVVTPERIDAWWNGRPFSASTAELQRSVVAEMATIPEMSASPRSAELRRPRFDPRGGLGLYVANGSAFFRAARVTPL